MHRYAYNKYNCIQLNIYDLIDMNSEIIVNALGNYLKCILYVLSYIRIILCRFSCADIFETLVRHSHPFGKDKCSN
jgi:hypothetical protein